MPKASRIVVNRVYYAAQAAMEGDWPKRDSGMNRAIIGSLLERGYPEADIVACAGYVGKGTEVRANDMRQVRRVLPSWIRAGRPERPGKPGEVARLGKAEDYKRLGGKVDRLTERLRRERQR
jgi:hypothetical protein